MAAIAERVRRIVDRFQRPLRCCSACHLPHGPERRLISGPGVYICESCIRAVVARHHGVNDGTVHCSFCGLREVAVARVWPELAICTNCAELARGILAEDDRRSRSAT